MYNELWSMHLFIKALDEAKIVFPTTKVNALEKSMNIKVPVENNNFITLASIIEKFEPEYYESGSAFFTAYNSVLYLKNREEFLEMNKQQFGK